MIPNTGAVDDTPELLCTCQYIKVPAAGILAMFVALFFVLAVFVLRSIATVDDVVLDGSVTVIIYSSFAVGVMPVFTLVAVPLPLLNIKNRVASAASFPTPIIFKTLEGSEVVDICPKVAVYPAKKR